MLPRSIRAEIARRNGALSNGPVTQSGKARSCRNAIVAGRRAAKLAEFVPPESAILSNEDRQGFYTLFDQNLAKYRPADPAEKALVRELTDLQWADFRLAAARQALLNRQLEDHSNQLDFAFEAACSLKSMAALRQELAANSRLITQLERRLRQMQRVWPAANPQRMNSTREKAAPPERTEQVPPQTVEKKEEQPKIAHRYIRYDGPLTPQVIAMYRKMYPNHSLSFVDGAANIEM